MSWKAGFTYLGSSAWRFARRRPVVSVAIGLWSLLLLGNVVKGVFDLGPRLQASAPTPIAASAPLDTKKYDAAMAEIRAERSIIAASWGPYKGASLYVAVKDDGSRRDGYAEYLCMILRGHDLRGVVIHVMTPSDYKDYNTGNDLGRHICE